MNSDVQLKSILAGVGALAVVAVLIGAIVQYSPASPHTLEDLAQSSQLEDDSLDRERHIDPETVVQHDETDAENINFPNASDEASALAETDDEATTPPESLTEDLFTEDIAAEFTEEDQVLANAIQQIETAESYEELIAIEKQFGASGQPALAIGTVDAQGNTQLLGQDRVYSSTVGISEYAKNRKAAESHEITQYQGTIDAWVIQSLAVGDRFSIPLNEAEQATLRITSRSEDGKGIFIVAQSVESAGQASFSLIPLGDRIRLFGTLQRGSDVFDLISRDGQQLTIIEQRLLLNNNNG